MGFYGEESCQEHSLKSCYAIEDKVNTVSDGLIMSTFVDVFGVEASIFLDFGLRAIHGFGNRPRRLL